MLLLSCMGAVGIAQRGLNRGERNTLAHISRAVVRSKVPLNGTCECGKDAQMATIFKANSISGTMTSMAPAAAGRQRLSLPSARFVLGAVLLVAAAYFALAPVKALA